MKRRQLWIQDPNNKAIHQSWEDDQMRQPAWQKKSEIERQIFLIEILQIPSIAIDVGTPVLVAQNDERYNKQKKQNQLNRPY